MPGRAALDAAFARYAAAFDHDHGGFGQHRSSPCLRRSSFSCATAAPRNRRRSPWCNGPSRVSRRAGSTTSSAADFIAMRPTPHGESHTSRRCSTTTPSWQASI
jgi:hypothetical protein